MSRVAALQRRRHRGNASAAQTTVVTDTFTRANSNVSLGTADSGQSWVAALGTWGISTNRGALITADGGGINLAHIDSTKANATCQVTFTGAAAAGQSWLIFRFVDTSNYLLVSAQDSATVKLFSVVAGSFAELGTAAQAWADGDIVAATFSGTSITVSVNAVSKITASSSVNTSATKHGIGTGGAGGPANLFDNYTVVG